MKKYALIGYPLGHSMSPIIHKELFLSNNLQASYELCEMSIEQLKNGKNILAQFDGVNVTIPYKTNVIEKLDKLSKKAKLFGAVNTVDNKGGKLVGYNTDCHGFIRSLEMADISLNGRVLILGCGGVARMFTFESVIANCDVTLGVRQKSVQKADVLKKEVKEKLNKDIKIQVLEKLDKGWDLIINATPVGMYPNIQDCPISKEIIESAKAVFDAIYNPQMTKFIEYAKNANIKYSNGLAMLVLQAAVAQEIWYGAKFSDDDIKRVIDITQRELDK